MTLTTNMGRGGKEERKVWSHRQLTCAGVELVDSWELSNLIVFFREEEFDSPSTGVRIARAATVDHFPMDVS